jgi:hypothetical protein
MNLLKQQEIERLEAEIIVLRKRYSEALLINGNFDQAKNIFLWLKELEQKLDQAMEKYRNSPVIGRSERRAVSGEQ